MCCHVVWQVGITIWRNLLPASSGQKLHWENAMDIRKRGHIEGHWHSFSRTFSPIYAAVSFPTSFSISYFYLFIYCYNSLWTLPSLQLMPYSHSRCSSLLILPISFLLVLLILYILPYLSLPLLLASFPPVLLNSHLWHLPQNSCFSGPLVSTGFVTHFFSQYP